MKALLKKDIFCVLKSMKVFLLVIVLFAVIPGFSASSFAIIYAAMLPLTALAYDERSKWDVLAATMPYSPLQIVLSKYVLGLLGVLASLALMLASQSIINPDRFDRETLFLLLTTAGVGVLLLVLSLPLAFHFGVEKGRLFLMAMLAGTGAAVIALNGRITQAFAAATLPAPLVALLAAAALCAATAGSVRIAEKSYAKKQGR